MIQKLGKYAIVLKLGEGAMGAVYKAYDEVLDRHVAIKTMAEDIKWDPELKLRFYREARSAASLHHPNIVTIHDLGEEGKITYIVMELLEGKELKKIIQEKAALTLEKKLSIMFQVAEGLNHAHLHGIIHRDIKPGNIHVTPTGTVKILDFGIARIPSSDLTRSGVRLGTPIYMSPEQIRGGEYDERSDLFSTGIVFYELLTYSHPFRDKNIAKTLDNILFQTHLPFAEQMPDSPPGLWNLLSTCLAKEPGKRYGSMAEFGRACRNLLDELTESSQRAMRDLQSMLPRLRLAAERSGAAYRLVQLRKEVEELLQRDEKPDFLTLKRVSAELAQESASIQAAGPSGQPRVSPPHASAAGDPGAGPDHPAEVATSYDQPVHADTLAPVGPPPPTPEQLQGREVLRSGKALLSEGRLEEALEQLRDAMRLLGPEEDVVNALAQTRQRLDERKKARIADLLQKARQAESQGRHSESVHAVDEILELEPNHTEAVELRRHAVAELEAVRTRHARREQGEREKALGFRLLQERKFREGLVALRRAQELLGEDDSLPRGIDEAEEGIRQEELRAKVDAELSEAEKLLRAENYEGARGRARRAMEIAPENAEAAALLERIESTREARRMEQGEREKAAGFKLLSEKKYRESLIVLRHASEILGNDPAIPLGIEEAEEGMRADELRTKVQTELNEAQRLLRSESYDEARTRAQRALELSPKNSDARELLTQIDKTQEEKRAKDEIASLAAKSKQALLREEFEEADLRAREIFLIDPQNAQANDLLKRIDLARKDKAQKERIAALIAQSQQALLREEFQEAAVRAKEVFLLDPKNAQADELLKLIDDAEAKKQKQAQVTLLLTRGQNALNNENFAEAANQAREALRLDPNNAEAAGILRGIEQLQEKRKRTQIAGLLSQGRQALSREDYSGALTKAREALSLDPKNADAAGLIKAVEEAQEKHKRDQIAALLFESQQARGRRDFSDASRRAQEVLRLDPKHKEAKSLLKQIEKDSRGFEKQQERERKAGEKAKKAAAKVPEATQSTTDPLGRTVILRKPGVTVPQIPKMAIWIGAAVLLIGLAIAAYYLIHRDDSIQPPVDAAQQLTEAKTFLDQKNFQKAIEKLEAILKDNPGNREAETLLTDAKTRQKQWLIETLVIEAQGHRNQARFEDAQKVIEQILRMEPTNQQALDLRAQIQAEIISKKSVADQDREVEDSLARVAGLIRGVRHEEAKSELDKIERLRPRLPAALRLRRQLQSAVEEAGKRAKQEDTKKRDVTEDFSKQAAEQVRNGKYPEAQGLIDRWLAEDPQNSQARELRARVAEALRALRSFDAALREKLYDQALEALQQLEKVNPSDPNLANLRADVSSKKASAKAFLSLLRLGENATVLLDGQPLNTTGGELDNVSIPAGRHRLTVQSQSVQPLELNKEFYDGQSYIYVYDIVKRILRPFQQEDRELLARRKEREVTNRWKVEHSHGTFRGSCTGEIAVNGFQVEYRPDRETEHAIRSPFSQFRMSLDNREVELLSASDGRPIHKFKASDSSQARAIKQFWDRLERLAGVRP